MRYEQLKEILISAFAEKDLNEGNIIERTKEKLKMVCPHMYQAWGKDNFNVNHHFDITTRNDGNFTGTLSSAPANTYISIFEVLIQKGARVNTSNININAPFDYSQCRLEFAKTLKGAIIETSKNVDIIIPKTGWCTLLYIAIKENRLNIVTHLVDEIKVDITSPVIIGETFKTALDSAIYHNHLGIVKYLIEKKKVDFTNSNCIGLSPVHYAAIGGHLNVVKYLIDEKKVNLTTFSKEGNSPLGLAAREGKLDVVKYLVEQKNVNCNVANGKDGTPLQLSIIGRGDPDVIEYLLEKGANIHTKNNEGMTLIMSAALSGDLGVLQYIVEQKRGDIYVRDKIGRTILHCAAASGNLDVVQYLIKRKGLQQYINIQRSDNNWTTLYEAVYKGHYEVTDFLLSNGATVTLCDKDMNTPLHVAVENGHCKILQLLVRCYAYQDFMRLLNLDKRNKNGFTPLHLAVEKGHFDILNLLIQAGANVNMQDEKGNTPLDLTMYSWFKKMVAICYSTVN